MDKIQDRHIERLVIESSKNEGSSCDGRKIVKEIIPGSTTMVQDSSDLIPHTSFLKSTSVFFIKEILKEGLVSEEAFDPNITFGKNQQTVRAKFSYHIEKELFKENCEELKQIIALTQNKYRMFPLSIKQSFIFRDNSADEDRITIEISMPIEFDIQTELEDSVERPIEKSTSCKRKIRRIDHA